MALLSPCELSIAVSALANAIAKNLTDDQILIVGAVFTQLGDTLATISVQRDIIKKAAASISSDAAT